MRKYFERFDVQVTALITSFVTFIIIGTLVFHYLENWSWVDSAYFTVVTLTTVGYGDLSPTTEFSRIVTMIFILSGISIFGSAIAVLGQRRISKKQARIATRRKKSTK